MSRPSSAGRQAPWGTSVPRSATAWHARHLDEPRPRGRADDTARGGRLTIASTVLLLLAVATAATAQVMLKHGMQIATARAAQSRSPLALAAATSPWVLAGLAVFGISAVAWLAVLARVPLSIAYPFNALGYLGIVTVSVVFLHERASMLMWAGTLLVVSGLIMVVLARP
jgi:multidrug transporter EmrE-like cation transporter